MSSLLCDYMQDGACKQARATLMLLQAGECYGATVARWENCREQGYVVSCLNDRHEQLNIAFFEHRNSDDICAVAWSQLTMNAPTIDTAIFGDVYKTKWDVSHSVGFGQFREMADWIKDQIREHSERKAGV